MIKQILCIYAGQEISSTQEYGVRIKSGRRTTGARIAEKKDPIYILLLCPNTSTKSSSAAAVGAVVEL